MKKKIFVLGGLALLSVLVIGRLLYLVPVNIATGESIDSPNGKYVASVMDHYSDSFWGEKRQWFRLKVEDGATGEIIEEVDTNPIDTPYFGSRSSHRVVFWAKDSSAVEFRFPNVLVKFIVSRSERHENPLEYRSSK